jgi:hypothetical protein
VVALAVVLGAPSRGAELGAFAFAGDAASEAFGCIGGETA